MKSEDPTVRTSATFPLFFFPTPYVSPIKILESFLSKKPSIELFFSLGEYLFFTDKNLYENVIKQTPNPAEEDISMAGSMILRCHHLGQLPSLSISARKFLLQL